MKKPDYTNQSTPQLRDEIRRLASTPHWDLDMNNLDDLADAGTALAKRFPTAAQTASEELETAIRSGQPTPNYYLNLVSLTSV